MAENISSIGEFRNPEVLTHEELLWFAPGTTLSIIATDIVDARGRLGGLKEFKFLNFGLRHPEVWKSAPKYQTWFQEQPGFGWVPVDIWGSTETLNELVKGEKFNFLVYDIVDPREDPEARGEDLFRITDREGKTYLKIPKQTVEATIVSMQLELPSSE